MFTMWILLVLAAGGKVIVPSSGVKYYANEVDAEDTLTIEVREPGTYLLFSAFEHSSFDCEYRESFTRPTQFANHIEAENFTTPFLDFSKYAGKVTV